MAKETKNASNDQRAKEEAKSGRQPDKPASQTSPHEGKGSRK